MPELPEVETLRRSLLPFLPTSKICKTEVTLEKIVAPQNQTEFEKALTGKIIAETARRGKYLILHLKPNGLLLIHLRMTGQLFCRKAGQNYDDVPHTHVKIFFDKGDSLQYADVRQFGKMTYYEDQITDKGFLTLGPEPFAMDFTPKYLLEKGAKRKSCPLKSFLLDQSVIAGLGNIYADEVLYRTNLHPLKPASSLTIIEAENIVKAVKEVLTEAIAAKGSSMSDYLDANRERGFYQNKWRIYQKTGQPCLRCGSPVEKLKIGGRSSHFCPLCQSLKDHQQKSKANKIIIGLTGGIASGKSAAVEILKGLKAQIVDADEISRSLTAPEGPAQETVIAAFGEEFRSSEGFLDRKKLGSLIFNDPQARQKLNNLLHPIIIAEIQKEIRDYLNSKSVRPLILDIPLLFEAELEHLCHEIWLIWTDTSTQIERLKARDGLTQEQAETRLRAQMPLDDKKALSDYIIDNSGSKEDLAEKINDLYKKRGFKK